MDIWLVLDIAGLVGLVVFVGYLIIRGLDTGVGGGNSGRWW